MKPLKFIYIAIFSIVFSCDDGYIDDISRVDPGPDEENPTVNIIRPGEGLVIRVLEETTSITIEFEISDDIRLNDATVSVDGSVIATYGSEDFIDYRNFNDVITHDGIDNGEHTVSVTATDESGKSTTSTVNFSKAEPYQPMDGEVLYIPFDGEVLDLITLNSGEGSNISFADGVAGQALSLNVARQAYAIFEASDNVIGVENFTLSFWVRPEFVDSDNSGGIDGVLGLVNFSNIERFWGNFDFFVENGSNPDATRIRLHITHNSADETWITDVNDLAGFFGEWSHQVVTYDASTSIFNYYVDGVLTTTATSSWGGPLNFENAGPMVFGAVQFQTDPSLTSATGNQPWASYLTGELDEVRFFNRAFTQEEVTTLYENERPQ
ncbi:LamG domain-containing protein [Mangrovivirga cuniculi]|uniref:LamG-like jellyroll fold domain-containing protein n=1 Tax=Mangrovivirga cuniculi TaxID=2715131 RepID=A0A4D7K1Z8_9BACT|nr:LamG domain-containing protein [Mangrovivirga cuniculi]QCK14904.1 hypothetical protein DCC35_09200 [Mangrovivirga cuniculi]